MGYGCLSAPRVIALPLGLGEAIYSLEALSPQRLHQAGLKIRPG